MIRNNTLGKSAAPRLFALALACALAASLGGLAKAQAAGNPSDSSAPSPETVAAKADLARLATAYSKVSTISYTSLITLKQSPDDATPVQVTVKALIANPSQARLEIYQGDKLAGLFVSDGKVSYAYNPSQEHYLKINSPGTMVSSLASELNTSAPTLGNPSAAALATPIMLTQPNPFDISVAAPAGSVLTFSDSADTLNGKPVSCVAEKMSEGDMSTQLRVYIDKVTALPCQVTVEASVNGKSFEPLKEEFQNMQTQTTAPAPSYFQWSPPAAATATPSSSAGK